MTTILVVDDVAANRYMLATLLRGHGYDVLEAANGAEALALAERSALDLVVTDLQMPKMDGFELCRRWQLDERLRAIPFVVYTATYTDPADEKLALDLGATSFLIKPQAPEVLIDAVREVLERSARGVPEGADVRPAQDAIALVRQHNEALSRKLEKKIRALEEEIAERRRLEAERVRADAERRRLREELLQAQKLESIGKVAAGMAHDVNNMLFAISAYTQRAMRSLREGDPLLADLAEVSAASDRAAALTRRLLAFARKQSLAAEVLEANEVLARLERMLRHLVRDGVELSVKLGDPLDLVCADPAELEQALVNLVLNASDAIPTHGTITIGTFNARVSDTSASGGARRFVAITVADTGSGMDAATLDRVFEPFFTTKDHGTGLGLASVYGFVTQSGGRVSVESEPGRGTTFTLLLPSVDDDVARRGGGAARADLAGTAVR